MKVIKNKYLYLKATQLDYNDYNLIYKQYDQVLIYTMKSYIQYFVNINLTPVYPL